MVPEEADRLSEKFDCWARTANAPLLLNEAQNNIEHDARGAAPQHRRCLDCHRHDAGSRNPGNQALPQAGVESARAYQIVSDQCRKGGGRNITQGLGNAGRQRSPAQGKRRGSAEKCDSRPRRQPQDQKLINGHREHPFLRREHRTQAPRQRRRARLPARRYSSTPRTCIWRRTPQPKRQLRYCRATASAKRVGR